MKRRSASSLSIAAVASTSWFSGLVVPFGTIPSVDVTPLLGLVRWVPPILVGAAIAWGGITSVGRIVAAGVGLLALWIGPALITAISNAAARKELQTSRDSDPGADVFGMALTMPGLALPPIIVAVTVAAVGLVARAIVTRRRTASARVEHLPR